MTPQGNLCIIYEVNRMRIKIGSLKGQPGASLQWAKALPGDVVEVDLPVDVEIVSPIAVDVIVSNTGKGLLVKGTVACDVRFQCTRCLQEFPSKLAGDLEEFYGTGQEEDVFEEEDDFFPDEAPVLMGDEIDLTGPIREALLLAIPMKILCSEDCPGLCPQCGKPLATEACGCEALDTDLRFAPLLDLFKTQEKKQERGKDDGSTKAETLEGKN